MRIATALLVLATLAGCAGSPLELRVTPSYLALQEYGYLEVHADVINTSGDTVMNAVIYDNCTVGNDNNAVYPAESDQPLTLHDATEVHTIPRSVAPNDTLHTVFTVAGYGEKVSTASADRTLVPGAYKLDLIIPYKNAGDEEWQNAVTQAHFRVQEGSNSDDRIVRSLGSIKDAALRRKDMTRYVEMFSEALSDATVSDAVLYRLFDALKGFAGIAIEPETLQQIASGLLHKPYSRKWSDVIQTLIQRYQTKRQLMDLVWKYYKSDIDPRKMLWLAQLVERKEGGK